MTWRRVRKVTGSAITSRCSPFSCSKSQKKADMKSDADLFKVVANEPASENVLRSCTELGFPA